ncbi:MAG: phosphotransferase enzyme family protein, partial [Terriglobales bacterium]
MDIKDSATALYEAARELDLNLRNFKLISSRANDVWLLPMHGVVARVSMRPEELDSAERSLKVARWLHEQQLPVAPPWRHGPTSPIVVGNQAVTLWEEMNRLKPKKADLGKALGGVHSAGIPPQEIGLPDFDPIRLARWAIPVTGGLDPEQRAFARHRIDELSDRYAQLNFVLPKGIVHGDVHVANALTTPGPRGDTVISDWDFASVGPQEWDLIPTALESYRLGKPNQEQRAFADAYGFDVRHWEGFGVLRELTEWWMIGGNLRLAAIDPAYAAEARMRVESLRANRLNQFWNYGPRTIRSQRLPAASEAAPRPPTDARSSRDLRISHRRKAQAIGRIGHPADAGEYIAHRWP